MKTKGIKFSIITILTSILLMGLGMFFVQNQKSYNSVVAADAGKECFMVRAQNYDLYDASESVGSISSGLNQFVLGTKDISISASARNGYKIVGWNIKFTNEEEIEYEDIQIYSTEHTFAAGSEFGLGEDVEATIVYSGNNSSSIFKLGYVFADMEINPIYEIVYYDVNVTDAVSKIGLPSNNIGDIYYIDNEGDTYFNAIRKVVSGAYTNYYYLGTVVEQNGEFFTKQTKVDKNSTEELVNIENGSYKLGAEVETVLVAEKPCVVNSVSVNDVVLKNGVVITSDSSLKNTTKVSFGFTMGMQNAVVKLDVTRLYKITLNISLDDTKLDLTDISSDEQLILNNIKVQAFSKIDNTTYYAKCNNAEYIQLSDCYSTQDGKNYLYYTCANRDKKITLTSVSTTYNIYYTSALYTVSYKFAEIRGDKLQLNDAYTNNLTVKSQKLTRGSQIVIVQPDVFAGYQFEGVCVLGDTVADVTTLQDWNDDNTNVINAVKPGNVEILLCYSVREYSLQIKNINSSNGLSNEFKAISSIVASRKRAGAVQSLTIANNDVTVNYITLDGLKFSINDKLTLQTRVNNGFVVKGFSFNDSETDETKLVNEFEFLDEILNNYNDGSIEIYVYEEKVAFTLTYIMGKSYDTSSRTDVFMGTISAGAVIGKYYNDKDEEITAGTEEEKIANASYQKIIITGFVGDKITLSTTNVLNTNVLNTYAFNRFKDNDIVDRKITPTKTENALDNRILTYSYEEELERNTTIYVYYTMKINALEIVFNKANAYAMGNLSVTIAGTKASNALADNDMFICEISNGDDIVISIQENNINFGYKFVKYKVDGVDSDEDFVLNLTAGNETIEVEICFDTVGYDFVIKEFNGDSAEPRSTTNVKFDINKRSHILNKNVGEYAYSVDINGIVTLEAQNNEARNDAESVEFNTYTITLSEDLLMDLAQTNERVINVRYTPYEYQVVVNIAVDGNISTQYELPSIKVVVAGVETEINTSSELEVLYDSATNVSVLNLDKYEMYAGLQFVNWTEANEEVGANLTFDLGNITKDRTIYCNFNRYEYDVKHNNNDVYGKITANEKVKVGDLLTISVKANVQATGYKLEGIRYLYNNVEIFENSVNYTSFNPSYFEIKEDENGKLFIEFVIEYIPLEFNVLTISTDYLEDGKGYFLSEKGFEGIKMEAYQYATYHIYATEKANEANAKERRLSTYFANGDVQHFKKDGTSVMIKLDGTTIFFDADGKLITENADQNVENYGLVTVLDYIKVKVEINEKAIGKLVGTEDTVEYNLTRFVEVKSVNILLINYTSVNNINNKEYEFTISVNEVIANIANQEEIIMPIEFVYKPQTKQVSATTNISKVAQGGETFYKYIGIVSRLASGTDRDLVLYANSTAKTASRADIICDLDAVKNDTVSYSAYFDITDINIMIEKTPNNWFVLDKADWKNYGFTCSYANDTGLAVVNMRYLYNTHITYVVSPNMDFGVNNNGYFEREFKYDKNFDGVKQELVKGTDFTYPTILTPTITYTNEKGEIAEPINAGRYNVNVTFASNDPNYLWVGTIEDWPFDVVLEIKKAKLRLDKVVSNTEILSKQYDTNSSISITEEWLKENVIFVSSQGNIPYATNDLKFASIMNALITQTNAEEMQEAISKATQEGMPYYNLKLENLNLKNSSNEFAKNFVLDAESDVLIFFNRVEITKRQLLVENVDVYDRIYDAINLSKDATIKNPENIKFIGLLGSDLVYVSEDLSLIKAEFDSATKGANKTVTVDLSDALVGPSAENYFVNYVYVSGKTIYPDMVDVDVAGFGRISLKNTVGLTDMSKADLIPVNAVLIAETIEPDTAGHAEISSQISSFTTGTKVFEIGFRLKLYVGEEQIEINNNLYLSLPIIKDIADVLLLGDNTTNSVSFENDGEYVIVNLADFNDNLEVVALTKNRQLFTWWQILLIVIGVLMIIAIIVIVLIILRKRKIERYSIHDKI